MPDKPKSTRKRAQAVNLDTLGLEMGNKPPQALDVEEAVLGAMLIEPSSVDMAIEELSPSCFYDPRHRMIYEAMSALVIDHTSVDIVTVSAKLREQGNLEAVGGPVAIAGLSEKVGAAAHIEYYVKILKQKSIQRDLIKASYEILKDSYDDSVNVDQLIDEAQTKIYNAIQDNLRKDVQEISSIINDAMRAVEKNQENDYVVFGANIKLVAFVERTHVLWRMLLCSRGLFRKRMAFWAFYHCDKWNHLGAGIYS